MFQLSFRHRSPFFTGARPVNSFQIVPSPHNDMTSSYLSVDGLLPSVQRWVVFSMLALTTLVLMINSHDSGIAKTPLFVLCALLIAALSGTSWLRTGRLEIHLTRLDVAVIMLLVVALISSLTTTRERSPIALQFLLSSAISFFAGSSLFDRKDRFHQLLNVLAWFSGAVGVAGLLQFFFNDRLVLDFFTDGNRRVGSTLGNAVFLSGYIVLTLPLMAVRMMDKHLTRVSRVFHGALVTVLTFLLVISQSRSSYVAFAVGGLALLVLITRFSKRALVSVPVVILLGGLIAAFLAPNLGPRIGNAFSFEPTSSFARRLYFWSAGLEAFKAAPFLGHGPGSYEVVMREYRSPDYWIVKSEDVVPHAHNELIEVASDLGVFGLVVFLAILGLAIATAKRVIQKGSEWHRLYSGAISCSLLAIFVDNMANVSLRQAPVAALAWLILGVLDSRLFSSQVLVTRRITFSAPRWVAFLPVITWCVFVWFTFASLRRAVEADAHIMRGVLAHVDGRTEKAIDEFTAALALDQEDLFVRSNLSLTLLKANRFTELLAATKGIHRFSPSYPKSNLMQAIAFYSLRQYPDALESIQREIELRGHPEAFYVQALTHQALGNVHREQMALENLVMSCGRGRIEYQLEAATARLLVLAANHGDLERLKEMMLELARNLPDNRVTVRTLQDVEARLAQPEKQQPVERTYR